MLQVDPCADFHSGVALVEVAQSQLTAPLCSGGFASLQGLGAARADRQDNVSQIWDWSKLLSAVKDL